MRGVDGGRLWGRCRWPGGRVRPPYRRSISSPVVTTPRRRHIFAQITATSGIQITQLTQPINQNPPKPLRKKPSGKPARRRYTQPYPTSRYPPRQLAVGDEIGIDTAGSLTMK